MVIPEKTGRNLHNQSAINCAMIRFIRANMGGRFLDTQAGCLWPSH